MIKKNIQDELNSQINAELYSAYLYLSMSAYFESLNLKGFANWMRVQSQEEMVHVMKFYNYVVSRGGRVILDQVAAPATEWENALAVFQNGLTHEQYVTDRINKLMDLVIRESDHATNTLLQWFVTEQVEEEASADAVVQKLKLIGKDTSALFLLDQELAARVFVPPVPAVA